MTARDAVPELERTSSSDRTSSRPLLVALWALSLLCGVGSLVGMAFGLDVVLHPWVDRPLGAIPGGDEIVASSRTRWFTGGERLLRRLRGEREVATAPYAAGGWAVVEGGRVVITGVPVPGGAQVLDFDLHQTNEFLPAPGMRIQLSPWWWGDLVAVVQDFTHGAVTDHVVEVRDARTSAVLYTVDALYFPNFHLIGDRMLLGDGSVRELRREGPREIVPIGGYLERCYYEEGVVIVRRDAGLSVQPLDGPALDLDVHVPGRGLRDCVTCAGILTITADSWRDPVERGDEVRSFVRGLDPDRRTQIIGVDLTGGVPAWTYSVDGPFFPWCRADGSLADSMDRTLVLRPTRE